MINLYIKLAAFIILTYYGCYFNNVIHISLKIPIYKLLLSYI